MAGSRVEPVAEVRQRIPVLLYHDVSIRGGQSPFGVTPAAFREHLDVILASERTPLTLTQLAVCLRAPEQLPARPVVITFDDGYADWPAAIAEVRSRGLKSTMFVTTQRLGQASGLTASQLSALVDDPETSELGAHTVSHPRLDELPPGSALQEIRESRERLEQAIGSAVNSFAYPHGAYDRRVRQMVIDSGFSSAAAVKNALSHVGDDPWAIARWTVKRTHTGADIDRLLTGDGIRFAWDNERIRTRAFRIARRSRRVLDRHPGRSSAEPGLQSLVAPAAVIEVERTRPTPVTLGVTHKGQPYRSAAVLVRDHGAPVDWLAVPAPSSGQIDPSMLPLDRVPSSSEARPGLELPDELISVVIPTCGDAGLAVQAAKAIRANASGRFEVIVVDNRPRGSTVAEALSDAFPGDERVRVVPEERQGLSCARNTGLGAAAGEIVAFIDDDVLVDDGWMKAIRQAFAAHPDSVCVTGPILPTELEHRAQIELERFASLGKGFARRRFSLTAPPTDIPLFPYTAGFFGSGANAAFLRADLIALGAYDERLGAGTPTLGGEDLDIYFRIVRSGSALIYEPRSVIWHRHPNSMRSLKRQAFDNGVGLGAFGAKVLVADHGRQLLRLLPQALRYLGSPTSRKNAERPRGQVLLSALEWIGMALGPVAYVISLTSRRGSADDVPTARSGVPTWCGELELSRPHGPEGPLLTSVGRPFPRARLLVRAGGAPIGFVDVELDNGVLDWAAAEQQARATFDTRVNAELSRRETARELHPAWAPGRQTLVSMIVCTRNRAEGAHRCIQALQLVKHTRVEIIVVDNAPDDDSTRAIVDHLAETDPRIRYVRESQPGLSRARNRGLAEAHGAIVAYTDDDVRVDPLWIDGLLGGFARASDVGCVTGIVASASLEHPAERFFDGRVWWSSSCDARLYGLESPSASPLHPYASGVFGTGANIAFDTDLLRSLGGFDECLGAGSATAGGEDLDIFVRVLRAGRKLAYEPAALVWHEHRVTEDGLRKQMHGYGKGLTAYLTKYLLSSRTAPDLTRKALRGILYTTFLARRSRDSQTEAGLPNTLVRAEWSGMAAGPRAYIRARRSQTRARRRAVAP